MKEHTGGRIVRKLGATVLSTFIVSMIWSGWEIAATEDSVYYQGTDFFFMTLIYFLYMGFFVLVYGNAVSFSIESLQNRWFKHADWLYVLILGGFGSAIGLIFPYQSIIFSGILAAALFGVIDKWLLKRWQQDKGNKILFIVPVGVFFLLGGFFYLTSPELPPHTAEDAVKFATSGDGTSIDRFPDEAGTWKGEIEGYQVERTTSAEQLDEENYLVTFTETWQKGTIQDSWMIAYRVDRSSSTLHDEEGDMPPYER
ncbi:hypothetical protein [Planococcus sp. CAU13]|uniref:hypothetical protein n=1 Tax=Planococcus sp. CAU13 TaxID=1541197 RepID=UPI00052FEB30|nr:hypothetical protein [Planococcus sp. CAU13]